MLLPLEVVVGVLSHMRKTAVSMQMKLAVIRLRNEHQSIRNIAKTLGMPKSADWFIINKIKQQPVNSIMSKDPVD